MRDSGHGKVGENIPYHEDRLKEMVERGMRDVYQDRGERVTEKNI